MIQRVKQIAKIFAVLSHILIVWLIWLSGAIGSTYSNGFLTRISSTKTTALPMKIGVGLSVKGSRFDGE